jgi:hypothetical protein
MVRQPRPCQQGFFTSFQDIGSAPARMGGNDLPGYPGNGKRIFLIETPGGADAGQKKDQG